MSTKKLIITRFAPSPTGFMHMGSVRTALFSYLFARQNGGKFILRIEDTDRERSKKEFDDAILDAMRWLGLEYDERYRQSERGAVYRKRIEKLLKEGKAFVSKEEGTRLRGDVSGSGVAKGEGKRSEVIRFKNPNKVVKFTDLIRGEIAFDTSELGDFVIAKSMEEPVFHLAVAVDDAEMGITHVIRGEDHISNTPRHILIFEALGVPVPTFAHLPLVLAPDRAKLSKRKHGEIVSLEYYRKQGYLSEAIINFMALIGWNPGDDREIFSLQELVKTFDLSKVQKGGAIFNTEKLNWFNRHYIGALSPEKKLAHLNFFGDTPFSKELSERPELVALMTERIANFAEFRNALLRGEYDYFFKPPEYKREMLFWKGERDSKKLEERLGEVKKLLGAIPVPSFTKDAVRAAIWPYTEKEGRGEVLWPLRVALSGREQSPDPFTLATLLGKEETLSRVLSAINLLS